MSAFNPMKRTREEKDAAKLLALMEEYGAVTPRHLHGVGHHWDQKRTQAAVSALLALKQVWVSADDSIPMCFMVPTTPDRDEAFLGHASDAVYEVAGTSREIEEAAEHTTNDLMKAQLHGDWIEASEQALNIIAHINRAKDYLDGLTVKTCEAFVRARELSESTLKWGQPGNPNPVPFTALHKAALLEAQEQKCAVCKEAFDDDHTPAVVDYELKSQLVRGVVHAGCAIQLRYVERGRENGDVHPDVGPGVTDMTHGEKMLPREGEEDANDDEVARG